MYTYSLSERIFWGTKYLPGKKHLNFLAGIVYLWCYEDDSGPYRVLPAKLGDRLQTNTQADCARRCSQYRYVGVEVRFALHFV